MAISRTPRVCVIAPTPILALTIETGAQDQDAELHVHLGGQGLRVARMAHSLGAAVVVCAPFGGERQELALMAPARLDRHEIDDLCGTALVAALDADTCVITGASPARVLRGPFFGRLVGDLRAAGITTAGDLSGEAAREAVNAGIEAEGRAVLARVGLAIGAQVTVTAPARDSSGASAALLGAEQDGRLVVERRTAAGLPESVLSFAVRAAPAMIAFVAAHGGFGPTPDFVLSGVNRGAHTGHAVLHSDTVGAAVSANTQGIRGPAVSLADARPQHGATGPALYRIRSALAARPGSQARSRGESPCAGAIRLAERRATQPKTITSGQKPSADGATVAL